jgi:hypothetical protein
LLALDDFILKVKALQKSDGRPSSRTTVILCGRDEAPGQIKELAMTDRPKDVKRGVAWNALGPGWHQNGKVKKRERRTIAIRRDLQNLEDLWKSVQSTRRRSAIYDYLIMLDDVARKWRLRRRVKALVRHAQAFTGEKEDTKAEMYSTLMRATTDADVKTVSKLSRVLRYCEAFNTQDEHLRLFIKRAGGLNDCAAAYTRSLGCPRIKISW